jgi:hypothetical protein
LKCDLYAPDFSNESLDALGVAEGIGKVSLRVHQTLDAFSKQKVCGRVQGISEHHIERVELLAPVNVLDEDLDVLLKDIDIAQTILDKLRPN